MMLDAQDGKGVLQQLARKADTEEQRDARQRGDKARRPELCLSGDGHRNGLRGHGAGACGSMECEAGGLARARIAGARSYKLEADLVDDAKANERGQREADADGEQVNIDG
jgi:hypothetical protein